MKQKERRGQKWRWSGESEFPPHPKAPSLLITHLTFPSPISHANMYIREQSSQPAENTLHELSSLIARLCQMRWKYTILSNTFWRPDLQHPFYLSVSMYFPFSLFFLNKDAVHLKIKQMTRWNPDCSSTACSQFHIYSCL